MSKLVSPAVGRITSRFGPRKAPTPGASTFHKGDDIADIDDVIVAPADGVVTVSTYEAGGAGNYVTIDHGNGIRTRHHHLKSRAVKKGDRVTAGQQIGIEGMTGTATGPHLHTEVHVNGVQVDPSAWYAAHGVTLGASGAGTLSTSTGAAGVHDPDPAYDPAVAAYQETQNKYGNAGLVVDGKRGPKTNAWASWVHRMQEELNQWKSSLPKLEEDDSYGPKMHARAAELQRRNGWPVTGILSDDDVRRMRKTDSTIPYRPVTH